MNSADMKLKKFEMLIRDIDKYLGSTGIVRDTVIEDDESNCEDEVELSPIELFIEHKTNNSYLDIILKNSFREKLEKLAYFCPEGGFFLSEYSDGDVNVFIEKIRKCNKCSNEFRTYAEHCSVPRHLMFWLIFIVSVDNENYNENLSIVSDVAFMIGFDEEKLADWIVAVKGVLEGKKLDEMEYKTEAAKSFFIR